MNAQCFLLFILVGYLALCNDFFFLKMSIEIVALCAICKLNSKNTAIVYYKSNELGHCSLTSVCLPMVNGMYFVQIHAITLVIKERQIKTSQNSNLLLCLQKIV